MKTAAWPLFLILMAVFAIVRIRKAPKESDTVLRQPAAHLFVGWMGFVFCGGISSFILTIDTFTRSSIIFLWSLMLVFVLMSYEMLLVYANWRVELYDDHFSYHTFLGASFIYPYNAIESYTLGSSTAVVNMKNGKKLYFKMLNLSAFKTLMCRAAGVLNEGEHFKEIRPRLLGMSMRGRRKSLGIINLCLCAICCLFGAAILLSSITFTPYTDDNTQSISVVYGRGEIKNPNGKNPYLDFLDEKGAAYTVYGFAFDVFAADDFVRRIHAGDQLLLAVEPHNDEDAGLPREVISIKSRGLYYLSIAAVNQRLEKNSRAGIYLGSTFILMSALLAFLTCYLLKHPDRHAFLQKGIFGSNYQGFV